MCETSVHNMQLLSINYYLIRVHNKLINYCTKTFTKFVLHITTSTK